jgi:hypothetical protein
MASKMWRTTSSSEESRLIMAKEDLKGVFLAGLRFGVGSLFDEACLA